MPNFILHSSRQVNSFTVKIYHIDNETVEASNIDSALADVSTLNYPSDIVEKLQDINGVSKIEVYDENNTLVLNSEKFIP